MEFGAVHLAVALVAAQRLIEAAYGARNARRLKAEGGVEVGAGHYPLFVALHGAWLLAIVLLVAPSEPIRWPALFGYLALQPLRFWVMATLGRYWTTRIITVPGAPVVARGPYRFCNHPNYAIVVGEVALLPLAFGAIAIAFVFSVLNLGLLTHRIRVEQRALAPRREPPSRP
ncbi:MAG: isoprenylcysteine carboxylmethyltransferase family protein [Rhodospirillales bacterium]